MSDEIQDELEQLFEVVVTVAARLRQAELVAHRSQGLSLPMRALLQLLRQHPDLTVPQLARQRGTSRQNTQVLVDRLAKSGFVRFITNPDHQRSDRVRLTATGTRSLHSANQRQAARLAVVLPHVTEAELRACLALLERIGTRLEGGKPMIHSRPAIPARKPRLPAKAPAKLPAVEPPLEPALEAADASPPETLPLNLL